MDNDKIQQKIYEYIVQEFKPEMTLDSNSLLIEEGIIDSLAVFTLIGFIEEQFGVRIDPEDVTLDNFRTVVAIRDLVESARSSSSPIQQRRK